MDECSFEHARLSSQFFCSGGLRPPEQFNRRSQNAATVACRLIKRSGMAQFSRPNFWGGVAERLNAPVLKTGRPKGLVSSNLTPSASPSRTGTFQAQIFERSSIGRTRKGTAEIPRLPISAPKKELASCTAPPDNS